MKVLFNATGYDSGKSGISTYMKHTLEKLTQSDVKVEILCQRSDYDFFKMYNLTVIQAPLICEKAFFSMLYSLLVVPFIVLFKQYDILFLPAANRRLCLFYPRKTIGVIHDLSQLSIKGKYDRLRMIYIRYLVPVFLRGVDSLFCVSNSTLNDVIAHFKIKPSKLQVNYLGHNSNRDSHLDRTSIESKNILYISRLENPGKNHIRLLEAYSLFSGSFKERHKLVFVGELWNGHKEIFERIKELKLEEFVEIKGHVSQLDLEKEFQRALALVFPSLYEGFGIPLLEAMVRDVPITCSNNSSLIEIGGPAVLGFDPLDPEDIYLKLLKIIGDKKLRESLVYKGRARVKNFCWNKHVDKILGEMC